MSWLDAKRYVFFSARADRFISVTAQGLDRLLSPSWGSFVPREIWGPMSLEESKKLLKFINSRRLTTR